MKLPHHETDVAGEDFQLLEDLATACWYSEVLFAGLELNVFELLGAGPRSAAELADEAGYDGDGVARLLAALVSLGLVIEQNGTYENGPLTARYLSQGGEGYAGDFLRYRKSLASHWQRLTSRVRMGRAANDRPEDEPRAEYERRVMEYVRVLDFQARIKAAEAAKMIASLVGPAPLRILDCGGGAGAWCRALLQIWREARAVLLDLPETLDAARKLYPEPCQWQRIDAVAGNALEGGVVEGRFDLVLLSNIIHAYGHEEAECLLKEALRCLAPGGAVLIHDYLADAHGTHPLKGRLYDLHMMLNTYNGRVYALKELVDMLAAAGLGDIQLMHLPSDTSLILAWREESASRRSPVSHVLLCVEARNLGFQFARVIESREVAVEPWVRLKCRFGCSRFHSSLQCPPFSPDESRMREILSSYTHALIVQSAPPSRDFHEGLLFLERSLFLAGHHEALAFGAGPCSLCSECPREGACRFPQKARPSLEACGVDVYETARRAGLRLKPVVHRLGYVKYVGLILFNEERNHADSSGPGRLHP
jgi:predicted metal-binding protein/ubiquinone/menaquinone biosynthesis C-methylase UbiE